MFAPTESQFRNVIRLFTGEKVRTMAGMSHVPGEKTLRVLALLYPDGRESGDALSMAAEGMLDRLNDERKTPGTYCCATCPVSYWQCLAAGGLGNNERELAAGLRNLREHRDSKGRWRR